MVDISNTDKIIDSRDVISAIDELETERQAIEDEDYSDIDLDEDDELQARDDALSDWDASREGELLAALKKLAEEADTAPDWIYGATLIHEDYFEEYIEDLINDCYDLPKEFNSGDWPWRHITIDYAEAADEAKQDYMEIDFDGETYLIRV